MTWFRLGTLSNASAWSVYRMRDKIEMDPVYQRQGDIWNREKRQMLIDTMINGLDVPKLYLHQFSRPQPHDGEAREYAMIDGKQRVMAIFDFVENRLPLHDDFAYLTDTSIELGGLTYADLSMQHPEIKADFDSYSLHVVTIEADDLEVIEDLFSRLNEAMPLNAAEKRNARPGPLPGLVRGIAAHRFFREKLPFGNTRYRHYDIAAKTLLMASRRSVPDTKKVHLDGFFDSHANSAAGDVAEYRVRAEEILDALASVFGDRDTLLRSVGMVSLYFLLFSRAADLGRLDSLRRGDFNRFEQERQENRRKAEIDITQADYHLLEFDRYAQSPNDGVALRYRLAVLDDVLYGGAMGFSKDSVLGDSAEV